MGTFRLSVTSIIFLSTFSNKIGLKTAFCVKGFHSSQHSFCSIVSPSITHCLVGHLSGWFSSVPSFFFFLFWVEGCKHIWYWFGAVRYDSYWLNWPIVKHHNLPPRRLPSFLARQMYDWPDNVVTRLAFVSLLLSFFPLPCAFSFPSILSYWAVLLRLKYWSLLRLTLAWRSALLLIVQQIQTSIFFISSSFSFQTPFTLLWFFWGFFFKYIYL